MTASEEFTSLTVPFRGELLAHCYRMLGSVDEAEDLVQETYLRAWRSFGGFEGRSSVRTWLYRIATNACLTAIERRSRRPLPSGLGGPREDPADQVMPAPDVPWLQPFPDVLFGTQPADPSAVAASRAGMRLALVAALQFLSAKQRAVLILRDVLDWPAAEAAQLLGTTTTAVNSALRRARAHLALVLPAQDQLAEPTSTVRRELVGRYAAAFENADVSALVSLLRQDVALEMPPMLAWFSGRDAVTRFFGSQIFGVAGQFRMVPTMANGQPALAAYELARDGRYHAHAVQVLTVTASGIARIVVFLDPGLFPRFGLPPVYGVPRGSPPVARTAQP